MTQQAPPAADKRKALDAFLDSEEQPRTTLDRSTLERYATCPAQAAFVASGRVNTGSLQAAAGEEVHKALGDAIAEYIAYFEANRRFMDKGDLRNAVWGNILSSRPDVQPDAIAGFRASLWAWTDYINDLHPNNIMRFDGGENLDTPRSGQLSANIADVTITSELDLLHSLANPKAFRIVDTKSGHKVHTIHDIARSFQFGFHAVLVFDNYKDVQEVEVCVWNTRINRLTLPVTFYRDDLPRYVARIRSAIGEWYRHQGKRPEDCDTWASVEACGICPAAGLCPAAGHAGDVAKDPEAFMRRLVAAEETAANLRKQAAAYVDQTGHDIVTESGLAFGRNKPAAARKAKAMLYQLSGANDEVQESDGGIG